MEKDKFDKEIEKIVDYLVNSLDAQDMLDGSASYPMGEFNHLTKDGEVVNLQVQIKLEFNKKNYIPEGDLHSYVDAFPITPIPRTAVN